MEAPAAERDGTTQRSATARLLRAYHDHGDTSARERLVEMYLPLVDSLVRRHSHVAEDYEDLFQVGSIGLINAIDRFDAARGQELVAFAVPTITGEIRRHLRDRAATVRLPRRVLELRRPTAIAQAELAASLGRAPSVAEVALRVAAPENDVALALDATRAAQGVELEADAEGSAVARSGADDRLFLAEAFQGLNERERRLVYFRYIRDMTPAEVARELGLSERQVSRATQAALAKLRAGLEGKSPVGAVAERASGKRLPTPRREPKMAEMPTVPAVAAETTGEESYHIELVRSGDAERGWIASVEELSGCEAHGATPDEAVRAVEVAAERWIAEAKANRREVPRPRSSASHSGRLMLRMPQTLHAELARAAQREDVSLNQFMTGVLAGAVEWRSDHASQPPDAGRATGWGRTALVANIVVLAVVGVVALILLIVALT